MTVSIAFLIVFLASFSLSLALVPVAITIGKRFDVADKPGGRRTHQGVISRLGGIAIYGGFVVAIVIAQFLPVPRFDAKEIIRFSGLFIGVTFVFIAGLIDDVLELGAIPQFVVQIMAGGIAIAFLIFIEEVNNPLTGQPLSWPWWFTVGITLFWMGLMMNTVNFLDGLDGLAGGVSLIAGLVLFIHSAFRLEPAQQSVSLLPLALVGASLGFLMYNFHPAKVFMGSSGSYVLGYTIGALSIIGGAKMATILLVMGLPLFDVIWLIISRTSQGRNPMQGDRGHLHFRLLDLGLSQRQIVLAYYAFCAFFGGLTLLTGSRLFKLLALIIMGCLALIAMWMLQKLQNQKVSAA